MTVFFIGEDDAEHWRIVKSADKICAYLKCLEEIKAGNQEFSKAMKSIKRQIDQMDAPRSGISWRILFPVSR